MTAHVISHRSARGKRSAGFGLAPWLVALLALAASTWLLLRIERRPAPPAPAAAPSVAAPPAAPPAEAPSAAAAPETTAPSRRRQRRPAPVPLDAPADGFDAVEILSATELAAISQARDADGASQFAEEGQAATTPAADAPARDAHNGQD